MTVAGVNVNCLGLEGKAGCQSDSVLPSLMVIDERYRGFFGWSRFRTRTAWSAAASSSTARCADSPSSRRNCVESNVTVWTELAIWSIAVFRSSGMSHPPFFVAGCGKIRDSHAGC